MNCVKLWALYPPTPGNLSVWAEHRQSNKIFEDILADLENGKIAVQNSDEAIYLPPGYIHATYTLEGGIAFGINYTTKECLPIITKLVNTEMEHYEKIGKEDVTPLLESINICIEEGGEERQEARLAFKRFSNRSEVKGHRLFRVVKEKAYARQRGMR